jgi:hypothetical protein
MIYNSRFLSFSLVRFRYYTSFVDLGRLVIIGSGWAGFKLLESIDQSCYDVVVISPRYRLSLERLSFLDFSF